MLCLSGHFTIVTTLKQRCKDILMEKPLVVMLAIHNIGGLALLCYSNDFMSMIRKYIYIELLRKVCPLQI